MAFVYLFERFPSLTQTFCYREVEELSRLIPGLLVWSIRRPKDKPVDLSADLIERVQYLPSQEELDLELGSVRRAILHNYPPYVIWMLRLCRNRPGKYRLREAAWLGKRLLQSNVDHVHTHFAGIGARTAWWIKKLYGINFSFTAHANDIFCDSDDPIELIHLVESARFVITVSNFSCAWLVDRFPGCQGKIHRIYNGIKMQEKCLWVGAASIPLILSVGRLIEKKGFEDLITACAFLRDQGTTFQCMIVGGGPLEQALHSQIDELSLGEYVFLVGPMANSEVRVQMSKADVFALACVNEVEGGADNLPTVLMEAMDIGLPVVSTRVAGVPEMVDEGTTGFLVPERDPKALAEGIQTLIVDRLKARAMGEEGKKLADKKFSIDCTVRELQLVFECYGVSDVLPRG